MMANHSAVGDTQEISDGEFLRFRRLLQQHAGIALSDNKKALIASRLQKRLHTLGIGYSDYLQQIEHPAQTEERQCAIELLTTNETYFWRESAHFGLLTEAARGAQQAGREFRAWSAACASGEEVYSMAMALQNLCDQGLGLRWQILGSDISMRMLQRAVKGHYPLQRAQQLPRELLSRYCLRGTGEQQGSLLVARELRRNISFAAINLIDAMPQLGRFDAIFLRNVLIYFDAETKRRVVHKLIKHLRPGGLFCVGLAENLGTLLDGSMAGLQSIAPGAYRLSEQE
ncbi:CheR family methyltransferase [Pseudomarimonas arenosa]|uniref:Chemotaxis protein methyltransferase n=1 Tax=Pseudomarimonas arenosa TaxID=2774145 RepID=A0AAW3ZN87_9GAMM|nr:CheR family methyltransferase [Pseudomarimonas arenosa]MBD8527198.1 SAM-dependent methyltransferase [Pseudomarimonas arenosa]